MPLANTADRQREIIGDRALLQRRRRGLKQRPLAESLGWGANRISQVEHAETSLDTTELYDLAEALGCSVDYLLGLSEDFSQPQVTHT